jgi:hypothetical protein
MTPGRDAAGDGAPIDWDDLDDLAAAPAPEPPAPIGSGAMTAEAPAPVLPDAPGASAPALRKSSRDEYQRARQETVLVAARGKLHAMKKIADHVASPEADVDDCIRAAPVLARVIEHQDKMDEARAARERPGTIANFSFVGGVFSIEFMTQAEADALNERERAARDANVIDAEPAGGTAAGGSDG